MAQRQESFLYRLKTVAHLRMGAMPRVFLFLGRPQWQPFMMGHQVEILVVDEDLVLGGLEGEYVAHTLVRDGIHIGIEFQKSVHGADSQGHFRAIVGVDGKGL